MRTILFTCGFVLINACAASAQGLEKAQALSCEIDPGAAAEWTLDGKINIEMINFGPGGQMEYQDIDIEAGTARLIGDEGTSDVTVSSTFAGLSFAETTTFGNVTLTTVFAQLIDGRYPLVSSRHVLLLTDPAPQQYYGFCAIP